MKKIITAVLMLVCTQLSVFAYDFIEKGIAYSILKDGTLSVTNKLKKDDDEKDQSLAYKGNVVVPATVSHSGKLYKVSTIGRYAFNMCKSLESVKISEGVSVIEQEAFIFSSLTSLSIPASVSKLAPLFISCCSRLSDIRISPDSRFFKSEGNCIYNKTMTELIFVDPSLKRYQFPATVRSVADFAFAGSKIKKLKIPNTITHIGGQAFELNHIQDIECHKVLKKLPGSLDWTDKVPLPFWATRPQ